ncbi:MAG: tyrosine-type recombinase/integrase [Parvibaculales bacterium]
MSKLTNRLVVAAKPPEHKRYEMLWDSEVKGFCCRVSKSGTKTFLVERRIKASGKIKQLTIGRVPEWSAEQARERAKEILRDFDQPDYLEKTLQKQHALSLEQAVERYIASHLFDKSAQHRNNTASYLRRFIVPQLKDIKIEKLKRQQLMPIFDKAKRDISSQSANALWRATSGFLSWCLRQELIENHPLQGIKPPAKNISRNRVLTLDELQAIWSASEHLSPLWKGFIRLLILTGQRREEVAGMCKAEISDNWWRIPAHRTKNERENLVFLTQLAVSQMPKSEHNLIFTTTGTTSVSGFSKLKKRLDRLSGVEGWRMHDIRRSFVTHLNEMQQPAHIVEACVNHISGTRAGVAGVYNRAEYREQRQEAFTQWSEVFEKL